MCWRKASTPSVAPYWSAAAPCPDKTRSAASRIASSGNSSGAGRPPAKDVTSGRVATLRISLMAEEVTPLVLSARRAVKAGDIRDATGYAPADATGGELTPLTSTAASLAPV